MYKRQVFSLFIVFLVNILIPKIMKSKTMLIVLLGLYISKAYVHYYGILDYVTSDLLFFSLARIAFSTGNKKSINTIVAAVIFVVTNCLYSYFYVTHMQHFKISSKQSTAKIIKNTRYVFV